MNELQGLRIRDKVGEAELMVGYRGITGPKVIAVARSEGCACGGVISVVAQSDAIIAAAVRSHQETDTHRAWRRQAGFE